MIESPRKQVPPEQLLGCWHPEHAAEDPHAPEAVEVEFRPSGELIYSIDAGDRWQVLRLTYRVEDSVLVTNQPSAPMEERTRFELTPEGTLVLEFRGTPASYRKGAKRAPRV
ncbi:MAG TPA: hypothetical protein VJ650_18310 [Gemmatimonadaceae bacterium]|nr:hypothetical protein [Gemmatimonadaceae bacterium]